LVHVDRRFHYPGDENLSPGIAIWIGSNIGGYFGVSPGFFCNSFRGIPKNVKFLLGYQLFFKPSGYIRVFVYPSVAKMSISAPISKNLQKTPRWIKILIDTFWWIQLAGEKRLLLEEMKK
jgi:hypothetical protein